MLINNIDIATFKAKLMDRNISNADFEVENDWSNNLLLPFISDKFKYKFKELNITLDVVCNDADELELMKSNLTKQLAISTIKFDDISYYYRGFMSDKLGITYIMPGNETLAIKMLVVAEKDYVTETMNLTTSKTITVQGNTETLAIVEITPTIDLIDLVLYGFGSDPITINNLTASKKVILDGEAGLVTVDGANKYIDTDFWDFPTLQPGTNTITCSRSTANITIKYKPRWI